MNIILNFPLISYLYEFKIMLKSNITSETKQGNENYIFKRCYASIFIFINPPFH